MTDTTIKITFRASEALIDKLKRVAASEYRSVNKTIERALTLYLNAQGDEDAPIHDSNDTTERR